jgi:hypothetical protein
VGGFIYLNWGGVVVRRVRGRRRVYRGGGWGGGRADNPSGFAMDQAEYLKLAPRAPRLRGGFRQEQDQADRFE